MKFELNYQNFPGSNGPLTYATVPWDSILLHLSVFELKIATAPLPAVADALAAWLLQLPIDRPRLVCTKIPTNAIPLAELLVAHGFYPIETILDLQLPLVRFQPVKRLRAANLRLRMARDDDLPALKTIAGTVFATDRFHLDPHIDKTRADCRYAFWVENAFSAEDWIFVMEEAARQQPAGFMHVRPRDGGFFDMGLAAVHPEYQNTTAGVWLYQEVLKECQRRGLKTATSRVSINNINSLKLAMRFGSIILGANATFHCYISGSATTSRAVNASHKCPLTNM